MKKILFTICMRSGSKGLKNKHFKKIGGKPLFHHTLNYVNKIKKLNLTAVSTNSRKILRQSKNFNVNFLIRRPSRLATQKSSKIPVIKHALIEAERISGNKFDYIADFDATSPLRKKNDFKNALKLFLNKNADLLITGTKSRKNPYFNMVEIKNNNAQLVKVGNFKRRQDAPKVYDMNASIYIWDRKTLLKSNTVFHNKTSVYLMPEERSIDIDNSFDLKIVSYLLKK